MVDVSRFPILFDKQWPITGLATKLAELDRNGLFREYEELKRRAPRRRKSYLVKDRKSTSRDDSNRFEERLAISLCHRDSRVGRRMGRFRLLDRQVPLQAKDTDERIGEVDLLGVSESGRLAVIELKVKPKGRDREGKGSPGAALMQGLRYAAIISANRAVIANEAKHLFGANVSEEPPIVVVLAPRAWWGAWLGLPGSTGRRRGTGSGSLTGSPEMSKRGWISSSNAWRWTT